MGAFNGIPESWTSREFDNERMVDPCKEAARQAREALDPLYKAAAEATYPSRFQKLYLVFEISYDNGYEEHNLCDIFSTKARAELDAEERCNKISKRVKRKWGISYQVSEWEVQE